MQLSNKLNFNDYRFWLLIITGLLIVFNLCSSNYSSINLLFWCVAISMTWRRRKKLNLESNIVSTILGLILITWLLFRGVISSNGVDLISRMYPIFSVLAIYLLASKASSIVRQFWQEILIVSLTGIPWEHFASYFLPITKVSILDAKISWLMLWYAGFDVAQRDNLVILPKGSIQIAGACSSFGLLGLMWQFCLVLCIYFSVRKNQQLFLWICSSIIALVINGLRLCLMALLVANDRAAAFDYWHGTAGAEIFTTAAILILALVYFMAIARKRKIVSQI